MWSGVPSTAAEKGRVGRGEGEELAEHCRCGADVCTGLELANHFPFRSSETCQWVARVTRGRTVILEHRPGRKRNLKGRAVASSGRAGVRTVAMHQPAKELWTSRISYSWEKSRVLCRALKDTRVSPTRNRGGKKPQRIEMSPEGLIQDSPWTTSRGERIRLPSRSWNQAGFQAGVKERGARTGVRQRRYSRCFSSAAWRQLSLPCRSQDQDCGQRKCCEWQ